MATVYSLICWGGRTGKVVTLSIASPCVVTLTNHGLRDGSRIAFETTGLLPTGITEGATYYCRYVDINTLHLYDTLAHAQDTGSTTGRIDTSGTQSGTHTAKSVLMVEYFTQYSGRWGASGSERCYDSFASWNTARAGATATDVEVLEVGESFSQVVSAQLTITVPSAKNLITSSIDGIRTEAFHAGNFPASTYAGLTLSMGHVVYTSGTPYAMLDLRRYRDTVDGITFMSTSGGGIGSAIDLSVQCVARQCICYSTTQQGVAITLRNSLARSDSNLIVGWYRGWSIFSSAVGVTIVNNILAKSNSAMPTDSAIKGFYYNNIVIGNTGANWTTQPTSMEGASHNYGLVGTAWMSAGGVRYTIATTDFVDFANNDFRPASDSSPQVDSGIAYYDILPVDLSDDERPNYNNGGSEVVDGGCYEFDHGYGPHPASTTVTFSGVNAGSEIRVYDGSANELAGVEACSANPELTWTLSSGDVRIVIIHPDYKIKEFTYTPVAGVVSLPVQQEPDKWYSNP